MRLFSTCGARDILCGLVTNSAAFFQIPCRTGSGVFTVCVKLVTSTDRASLSLSSMRQLGLLCMIDVVLSVTWVLLCLLPSLEVEDVLHCCSHEVSAGDALA